MPRLHFFPGRAAAVLAAGLCSTSFLCSEKDAHQGLPAVGIDTLRLVLHDPAQGKRGAYLAWNYPAGAAITSLELYRSLRPDSLGPAFLTGIAPEPAWVQVELPDSSPPFTVYFGFRAVFVEATGQKNSSDSIRVDSLRVSTPVRIYLPAEGVASMERSMAIEVGAGSDPGQVLRQFWYEQNPNGWTRLLDTCLPRNDCLTPLFGNVVVNDTIVLGPAIDSTPTLFCVLATETFSSPSRGLRQSLGCSRFPRLP